jgi:hypothetical protein
MRPTVARVAARRASAVPAALVVWFVLAASGTAFAYYLDEEHRFDFRVRAYSQLSVLTEDSETPSRAAVAQALSFVPTNAPLAQKRAQIASITPPKYDAGELAQHRNFYNPEFDANLTDFMQWAGADSFKFRFAWWGFYDGLYDYLDEKWADHARSYKTRFSESDDPANESYKFDDHYRRARDLYAHQNRINELYFDYTKGPLFIRVGKQAISWGESDTIAILDVSNPYDLSLGAPGFYQDVEEARIPLWTIRSTYKLFESLGPLSSVFSDVYFVPGPIDTTVPQDPITAGVSPFDPDQPDPQNTIGAQGSLAANIHTALVTRLPEHSWANSRWGVRLAGVLLRDYTVQGWFFRTFNQQPAPLLTNASAFGILNQGRGTFVDERGRKCDPSTAAGPCTKQAPAVTLLERRLESVIGLSSTWFSQPVNGILKWEIEYFVDELAVIPDQNLNSRVQIPRALRAPGEKNLQNSIPTADYVRWVVGYDRNFFVPALNPSNGFLLVMSYNSSFNLSEKGGRDYRSPLTKPGHTQTRNGAQPGNPLCQKTATFDPRTSPLCTFTDPHDYEDAYQYEGILTTTLRTDYMHGKLEPGLTMITDISGVFGFAPSVSYRINDNLFVGATYLAIAGDRKSGLGNFRAHDMLQLRVSGQFN